MLYHKTDSLIICILVHALFNGLSAFNVETNIIEYQVLSSILITVITAGYALHLSTIKTPNNGEDTIVS